MKDSKKKEREKKKVLDRKEKKIKVNRKFFTKINHHNSVVQARIKKKLEQKMRKKFLFFFFGFVFLIPSKITRLRIKVKAFFSNQ